MKSEKIMIQCVCCASTFTKDGIPSKYYNYNDLHIYGCRECKKGDWLRHTRVTLARYRLSVYKDKNGVLRKDLGYLHLRAGEGAEREFFVELAKKAKTSKNAPN